MIPKILSKGQNASLPEDATRINAVLSWAESKFEVDVSALLLGVDGKVGSDADFIFYNQPKSLDGSVQFAGIETTGRGARGRILIDLTSVGPNVQSIVLAGSVANGRFGALGELALDVECAGRRLVRYPATGASTESAFVFGEIYRRGLGWKIRAVGQGWESGLAGLATDFGVCIDDTGENHSAGDAPGSGQPTQSSSNSSPPPGSAYLLWGEARMWCEYELSVEDRYLPAIRSLFAQDLPAGGSVVRPAVQLIPEPAGPRGPSSISVRAEGKTIGYLDSEGALQWAGAIRRVVATGFVPTTTSQIWATEYDGWDGPVFRPQVRIALGEPHLAIPLNNPPAEPYTMIPRSAIVHVTKENEHFDVLREHVPAIGHGLLFVTLVENSPTGRAKPHVEVRVDDQRVGQLTPQMSQRFLPMIQRLRARGLTTACWGDIKGSAVAAEVRIDGIKANEATSAVLDGPPVTVAPLCTASPDPNRYDLTPMSALLTPLPPIPPIPPTLLPEPSEGSVIKFEKGSGAYHYIAVRRRNKWETTATGDWGSIGEVMSWDNLATRVHSFGIATSWSPVGPSRDLRVRAHLAVVRFMIGDRYVAAINVCASGLEEGDWYTTITNEEEHNLPFGNFAYWQDIATCGDQIQVATGWSEVA